MRDVALGIALVAALLVFDLAPWVSTPERRLARSAALAGLVIARVVAGTIWYRTSALN